MCYHATFLYNSIFGKVKTSFTQLDYYPLEVILEEYDSRYEKRVCLIYSKVIEWALFQSQLVMIRAVYS